MLAGAKVPTKSWPVMLALVIVKVRLAGVKGKKVVVGVSVYWPAGRLTNSKLPLESIDRNPLTGPVNCTGPGSAVPSAEFVSLPVTENVGCGVGVGVGFGLGSRCQ